MNYTNNVRCNDIKPLEAKLFKMVMRRFDYEAFRQSEGKEYTGITSLIDIAGEFADEYGVKFDLAIYYIRKWQKIGIVSRNSVTGQYKMIYRNILTIEDQERFSDKQLKRIFTYRKLIPARVSKKFNQVCLDLALKECFKES